MLPAASTPPPAPSPRRFPGPLPAALFLFAAAVYTQHARLFGQGPARSILAMLRGALTSPRAFVTDDAYISFVYARNLAEHGQLVFNLGEKPVEGYTNFLWTVLLAGLLKIGWLPEYASVVLGIGFGIATMGVCLWLVRRVAGLEAQSAYGAVPALFLALVPGYACWAAGGLETQMFTFFATLGMALYIAPASAHEADTSDGHDARVNASGDSRARPLRLGAALAFALSALTRPEGVLFFLLALLHRGLGNLVGARRLRPTRRELAFVAIFAAIVVPHFLFRRAYYGWWLPNTFYIKASGGGGAATWARGFYYLSRYAEALLVPAFLLPALLSLYRPRDPRTNRFYGYAALVLAVFWLYVASVGGDFMGLFRFAIPVVPLVVVLATLGLRSLLSGPGRGALAAAITGLLLVGYGAYALVVDQRALAIGSDRGIDSPGYLRYYTDDRAAIGRWFGQYAQPDDYAAVGGAGAQVYFSRIRSLDCFGLSDEHIAHEVPPVDTRPGHQKYAPLEYQLARKPTIITSNYYTIGAAPAPRPDEPTWRQRGYHYVSVEVPGLSLPYYTFLKRMDRRIGPLAPVDNGLQ